MPDRAWLGCRAVRIAVLAALVAVAPAVAQAAVIWRGDFKSTRFAVQGATAAGPDGWQRAEYRRDLPGKAMTEGSERTYAFSVMVEKALSRGPHQIARFASAATGKTLFAYVADGETVDLVTYEPDTRGHYGGTTSRLSPGKWHRVLVRVVWSKAPTRGVVDVYHDGDLMVHQAPLRTRDGDGAMLFGLGLSRAQAAAPSDGEAVLIDDVAETTVLADLRKPVIPKASGDFFADVEYARPGGEPLRLDAWIPKGRGPHPAVILVHGGGFIRGDKQSYVRPLFDVLADAGFAWFTIDYRLAPAAKWPAPLDDVEAAVKWVHAHAQKYRIDEKRVALFGESASGFLVSAAGVRQKKGGPLAAVLPWYTSHAFDLPKPRPDGTIPMPKGGTLIELFDIKDTGPATAATLRAASPLHNLHADMPPYLIYHSNDDPVATASARMCDAMKAAGAACDLFVAEGLGHGLGKWKDVPGEPVRLVAWLRKTLDVPASKSR